MIRKYRKIRNTVKVLAVCFIVCCSCISCEKSVRSITLDQTAVTLKVGDTLLLHATIEPEKAENKTVVWTSSDPTVAMVLNGMVIAMDEGTATISATSAEGEKTANCIVTVENSGPRAMVVMIAFADHDMEIVLAGTGAVKINWGDETEENFTLSTTPTSYKHDCASTFGQVITITGNNVTYMECISFDIKFVDVSKNTKLTELYCGGSFMDNIDLSKNTKLKKFTCYSDLSGLDVSKNTALIELDVKYCNFLADKLNALFETLHDKPIQGGKTIYIGVYGNSEECDKSIAEQKGWTVIMDPF
jgi:hypothetical protein